jgi:cobalamin biosynthesis Mg chelatase CobN
MERSYRRIQVAAKNVDNRESDILDSDDYFQYHGGMVATIRALTGEAPKAYVGDSTAPESVRTRTLQEETNRIDDAALRGIIEKLSEARDRGLWKEPDAALLEAMQQVYLDIEGDLEE